MLKVSTVQRSLNI